MKTTINITISNRPPQKGDSDKKTTTVQLDGSGNAKIVINNGRITEISTDDKQ